MPLTRKAYRAAILHSLADPAIVGIDASYEYFEDGLLVIDNGQISALGHASELLPTLAADIEITHYQDALITPGLIDTHIHLPQTGMVGAYGEQLLDWLNTYTFPCESQFADKAHAEEVADIFIKELLRNGTTTALVFGSVHPQSVNSFFEAAEKLDLRMIAGKVMMDRNAPDYLTDTAESGYQESKALIERWHGKGRLHYAVTPRFAPTSTPEQLTLAGQLLGEYPDLYMQTHISENLQEVQWVKELFPERSGYLDVYDHYKLLGERSVFAHGVHLCDDECARLAEAGSAVAFCPTSNFFLGSGLFNLPMAEKHQLNVGLGTDVGGRYQFLPAADAERGLQGHAIAGRTPEPVQIAVPGDPGRRQSAAPGRQNRHPAAGHRCRLPGTGLQRHATAQLSLEAGQGHCRDVVCVDDAGG